MGRLAKGKRYGAQSSYGEEVEDCKDQVVTEEEYTMCSGNTSDSLHNYWSMDLQNKTKISLAEYKDNVVLVVNLASF